MLSLERTNFRLRFSLRMLMLFVTFFSVACWMWVRSCEFDRRAEKYHLLSFHACLLSAAPHGQELQAYIAECLERGRIRNQWDDYCEVMENKYRHASMYPWLPVSSDPPEPEKPRDISLLSSE